MRARLRKLFAKILPPGIRAVWCDPDRPLLTHGPVVRFVVYMQAITVVGTFAALAVTIALSVGANATRIRAIQESRQAATVQQCQVLRSVVLDAFGSKHQGEARALLKRHGLLDCRARARSLTRLP